jgi:hypothetical protein
MLGMRIFFCKPIGGAVTDLAILGGVAERENRGGFRRGEDEYALEGLSDMPRGGDIRSCPVRAPIVGVDGTSSCLPRGEPLRDSVP